MAKYQWRIKIESENGVMAAMAWRNGVIGEASKSVMAAMACAYGGSENIE